MKHTFALGLLLLIGCNCGSNGEVVGTEAQSGELPLEESEPDEFPDHISEGGAVLNSTGGPFGDARFHGQPYDGNYSGLSDRAYFQTTPVAEGEAPLTYTLGSITRLERGVHTVENAFMVYLGDGEAGEFQFSGQVRIDFSAPTEGKFKFAYEGTLSNGIAESAVTGTVDVQLPVAD